LCVLVIELFTLKAQLRRRSVRHWQNSQRVGPADVVALKVSPSVDKVGFSLASIPRGEAVPSAVPKTPDNSLVT
jgi:hypothetical protein